MFQRLKSLFAKPTKPPVEFRHAEFGALCLIDESGLWSGETRIGDRDIRFFIGGTAVTPDAVLIERLRELLERFSKVERAALEFLCAQDAHVRDLDFEFYSLDFLWEDKPHLYTLEFTLEGDEDGIWRVEFENHEPRFIGRDD